MTKSLIPAGHEIRVLLTIKGGKVTERRLHDDEIVATPEVFVQLIREVAKAKGIDETTTEAAHA